MGIVAYSVGSSSSGDTIALVLSLLYLVLNREFMLLAVEFCHLRRFKCQMADKLDLQSHGADV